MTDSARGGRTLVDAAPNQPWQPECTRGAVRGRVIVRLAPGEVPDRLPSILSVMKGTNIPHSRVGNDVDGVVGRFSPALRVSTAFAAANTDGQRQRWDDLEHATGQARTAASSR